MIQILDNYINEFIHNQINIISFRNVLLSNENIILNNRNLESLFNLQNYLLLNRNLLLILLNTNNEKIINILGIIMQL